MKLTLALLFLFLFLCYPTTQAGGNATHYPGLFIGSTTFDGESNLTIGLEYEYRLSKNWGFGGAIESIPDAHKEDGVVVWSLMGFYHPVEHLKFGLGLGQERIGGADKKNKELLRFAAAYEIPITKSFEIAPTLDADFIDGEVAFVAGVAFIILF